MTDEPCTITSNERVGIRHDERMGNLPYCAYCGFGLVSNGLRECCAAGYDVDRLRAVLERAAGTLNSLRADVEHTLWPNSGFAAPEPRDG